MPAYWIVSRDIPQARAHLNFSEIGALPEAQQKLALFDAFNQIQLGAMPLPRYRTVHPEIVLEVAFDAVQHSSRHKSGFALRFPRIVRIREDKRPEDADTLERVEEIWKTIQGIA